MSEAPRKLPLAVPMSVAEGKLETAVAVMIAPPGVSVLIAVAFARTAANVKPIPIVKVFFIQFLRKRSKKNLKPSPRQFLPSDR
jgi:hypothetical protein